MADYTGITRTNYFRVKNAAAFLSWCKDLQLTHWDKKFPEHPGDTFYAITADDRGNCDGWPTYVEDEHGEQIDDYNFADDLAEHLDPRDVAILKEIGSEKLRYLTGYATAIDASGKSVTISLRQIDELAEKTFPSLNITECIY